MSSTTWTPQGVRSEAKRLAADVWRAVEAQHVVSTMALCDTLDEQRLLEELIDEAKPRRPDAAAKLHYLLSTPFRYRPPRHGSRFRGPNDPGVYYAADEVRTACAELGYWRWRHLADSPGLDAMPMKPQTVFRARLAASAIDLRRAPFAAERMRWTDPDDYAACQALARHRQHPRLLLERLALREAGRIEQRRAAAAGRIAHRLVADRLHLGLACGTGERLARGVIVGIGPARAAGGERRLAQVDREPREARAKNRLRLHGHRGEGR